MLIELFSLGVTAETLWDIGSKSAISLQRGPVDPKFQVEGVAPTDSSSGKTKQNDISYGIKISTYFLANVNSRSRSLFAIVRPSVCRLSVVCLSVVCLSSVCL